MRTKTFSRNDFSPTLPVMVIRRDPQEEFALHSHDFSELVIVYRGSGEQLIFGERRKIARGDVFLIGERTLHGYPKTRDLALFNVIFDLHDLSNPLPAFCRYPTLGALFRLQPGVRRDAFLKLDSSSLAGATAILEEMEREQEKHDRDCESALSALFVLLAVKLGRLSGEQSEVDFRHHASAFIRLFNRIAENPAGDFSRSVMAKESGMSASTLTRHFKELTGCAPGEYIQTVRLKKGAMLLLNGELDISEIAEKTGFCDSNYFCRQFRKKFGMPPLAYRKSGRGK